MKTTFRKKMLGVSHLLTFHSYFVSALFLYTILNENGVTKWHASTWWTSSVSTFDIHFKLNNVIVINICYLYKGDVWTYFISLLCYVVHVHSCVMYVSICCIMFLFNILLNKNNILCIFKSSSWEQFQNGVFLWIQNIIME